jgi:hypothetical protein
MINCDALKTELDNALALLAMMREKSLIRSVSDSDGSRIEYSSAGLTSQENYVRRLQAQYSTFCNTCMQASGPINFVFP